jgi:hypothetical protein
MDSSILTERNPLPRLIAGRNDSGEISLVRSTLAGRGGVIRLGKEKEAVELGRTTPSLNCNCCP